MTKSLYIAEKPSVAQEFAKALKKNWRRGDGYDFVNNGLHFLSVIAAATN